MHTTFLGRRRAGARQPQLAWETYGTGAVAPGALLPGSGLKYLKLRPDIIVIDTQSVHPLHGQ